MLDLYHNGSSVCAAKVRLLLAEKDIPWRGHYLDVLAGDQFDPAYLKLNPKAVVPTIVHDGIVVTESTVICEYLDEKAGGTSLIGTTPEERAETRMWTRRVDLNICENLGNGFRYAEGLKMFENRFRCLPEAAEGLKALAQDKLTWIDTQLEGKQFICGDRISMADILLFAFVEFAAMVGQKLNTENTNVVAWFERMKARPSAAA